jgi:hypothetical protein
MANQETPSFTTHGDLRVLLGRMETDMYMWSRGYEEITPYRLNQLLHFLQKAITLADVPDDLKKLQDIWKQLEDIQSVLLRSEPVDGPQTQQLAQHLIEALRALRQRRTSSLHPVAVEEVVGAHVIYFYHDLSTVGQVVRFQPAGEKRAFGFIGNIIIRPCDEQEAMIEVFQGVYALGDSPVSNLYHWPADLPAQTFLDPGRPKDLRTIEWAEPRHEDEDEDEDEGYSGPLTPSLVQQAGDYLKSMLIRRRISAGDGDQRIGMPAYSLIHAQKGYLKSIQMYADGSERWIVDGEDGKEMRHEGTFFWLEVPEYHQLFPGRVLSLDDLSLKLQEALQLYEEKAELDDHDEILHHQQQMDRILKFLNGDLADENQVAIATVYHQMIWSSVSLDAAQREQAARQTAIEIDWLRQNKEKS